MPYETYAEAVESLADVPVGDRLIIGRCGGPPEDDRWYACDIGRMPDGFAGIAWHEPRAADIAQAVYERKIRDDPGTILIVRTSFALLFMLYDSLEPANPDVQIVFGEASAQQLQEAIAESLLEVMNRPAREPVSDAMKASGELILKLVKTGTLDDGTPVTGKALGELLKPLQKPD